MYTVYMLRTCRNTLYVGQTNDLETRMKQHRSRSKLASKYMRSFESFELVYCETFETRREAMQREAEIKRWPRVKKERLMGI